MRLSTLILAAVLVGLICYACEPRDFAGAAPPIGTTSTTVCSTNGNGSLSLKPVPYVMLPFAFGNNTAPTPQPVTVHPLNSDVQADLAKAFANASSNFQTQLCRLDGIFIDPTNCTDPGQGNPYNTTTCNLKVNEIATHSWGLRLHDQAAPNLNGKRFIGLSLAMWNNVNNKTPNYTWPCPPLHVCAPPFQLYYTAVMNAVIHVPNPNSPASIKVMVQPTSFQMSNQASVLAALAHEFGHVYWLDNFVLQPGSNTITNNFCGGNFYPSTKWPNPQGNAVVMPFSPINNTPGRTRNVNFGDIVSGSSARSLPGNVHAILSSGNWASTLAAFSYNEDFVETFELKQLLNVFPNDASARLTSLQITSGPPHNQITDTIIPAAGGSGLAAKLICFN